MDDRPGMFESWWHFVRWLVVPAALAAIATVIALRCLEPASPPTHPSEESLDGIGH